MISALWLIPALVFGACVGLMVGAILTAGKASDAPSIVSKLQAESDRIASELKSEYTVVFRTGICFGLRKAIDIVKEAMR